uniref:Uncharacterized protein n=1 Tax=Anguilla anguilla TaxID=7936 RepID=A0A0E9PK70_ANGAN
MPGLHRRTMPCEIN